MGLYPDLTAREFLDYIAILKGLSESRTRRARVDELLQLVGLADVASRKLKAFSGGMKRRDGIAQALLSDPKLLIVDEPTAGLDPRTHPLSAICSPTWWQPNRAALDTYRGRHRADLPRPCGSHTGRVIFQGTAAALLSEANGHVWLITGETLRPMGDFTLVSTIPLAGGSVQYRIVGAPPQGVVAQPAQPNLKIATSGSCATSEPRFPSAF